MNLYKRLYVQNWDHIPEERRPIVTLTIGGKPYALTNPTYILDQVGYWRKDNHIHQWFVDNCQDGTDDCRYAYVSEEQLAELLDICREVKKDHTLAEELLPTQEGFFFGGTEVDEYYFSAIDDTIEILEKLDLPVGEDRKYDVNDPTDGYIYNSSW